LRCLYHLTSFSSNNNLKHRLTRKKVDIVWLKRLYILFFKFKNKYVSKFENLIIVNNLFS